MTVSSKEPNQYSKNAVIVNWWGSSRHFANHFDDPGHSFAFSFLLRRTSCLTSARKLGLGVSIFIRGARGSTLTSSENICSVRLSQIWK